LAVTSHSLLDRLRMSPDAQAWERLVALYTPLIRGWLRGRDLDEADVDDLTQEIMAVLVREVPSFRHNGRPGAFRTWLKTITVHRLRDFWRARQARPVAGGLGAALEALEDPHSGLSRLWDRQHDEHVAARLMALAESDFHATTWRAFQRVVVQGGEPAVVAAEMGLSVNAVLIAKSRVLKRLRQELRAFTG